MPIDPERKWIHEPAVEFRFPIDLNGESSPEQLAEILTDFRIPDKTDYRLAAERLLRVLHVIDDVMIHSREPARDWRQISVALGLPSCRYLQLTEAKIGRRFGITKMAVSKSVTKLLRLAELKPNGRGYNGRH